MAAAYATKRRSDLVQGDLSDFALANRQFLASRTDLDLVVWQTAAKERIRWLSAQLACAMVHLDHYSDVGKMVEKRGGDYEFDGTIVGAITKHSGAVRYVVEDDRGLLLIMNARQCGLDSSR